MLHDACTYIEVAMVSMLACGLYYEVYYNNVQPRCKMTWMYEKPQYIKVPMTTEVEKSFPKYSLYVYGEGYYAHHLRNQQYQFSGVPVVFVHGNAGSYRQARCFASVSLRKSETRMHHFNYFTIDYQEEFSAFYGSLLFQQSRYLQHAIERILRCYNHLMPSMRPTSVIAIGHSMGGLVIRGLFTFPSFEPRLINTVISLASPQNQPPIWIDEEMHNFYSETNKFWQREALASLKNVTFVSVGNGFNDFLVRSDLCIWTSPNENHMSVLTPYIPHIWMSLDHGAIFWCNEFIRATTRVLFKIVHKTTKQITDLAEKRKQAFQTILFHKGYTMKGRLTNCTAIPIKGSVTAVDSIGNCMFISDTSEMLSSNKKLLFFTYSTKRNWVMVCQTKKICRIPNYAVVPGSPFNFSFYETDQLEDLQLMLKRNEKVLIQRQTSNHALQFLVPYFFSTTSEYTFREAFFIQVNLQRFIDTWQAFKIFLTVNSGLNNATLSLSTQWSPDVSYYQLTPGKPISAKLLFSKPQRMYNSNPDAVLSIWAMNITSLRVTVQVDVFGICGQLYRFYLEKLINTTLALSFFVGLCWQFHRKFFCVYLCVFVVIFKGLLAVVWLEGGITAYMQRMLLPEATCLMISVLLSGVLQYFCNFILWLCSILLSRKLLSCFPKQSRSILVIFLFLVFTYLSYSGAMVTMYFAVCLLTHLGLLQLMQDDELRTLHWTFFRSLIPIIVASNVPSVLVYVKDVQSGIYSSLTSPSLTLHLLTYTYTLFLIMLSQEEAVNDHFSVYYGVCITAVSLLFFEVLPFHKVYYFQLPFLPICLFLLYIFGGFSRYFF